MVFLHIKVSLVLLRTRAARLRHPRRQREHQPYGRRVTCRLQAQSGTWRRTPRSTAAPLGRVPVNGRFL